MSGLGELGARPKVKLDKEKDPLKIDAKESAGIRR